MTLFLPGAIPLALLDAGGAKIKTLYLPAPDRGVPAVEWEKDCYTQKIPGVGERERLLGYLPILTLSWKIYDDLARAGVTIGTAAGNRPSAEQLLQILSAKSGTLKIGAGPGAGGFVVGSVKTSAVNLAGPGFASGLTLTIRGRDLRPDMTLGSF